MTAPRMNALTHDQAPDQSRRSLLLGGVASAALSLFSPAMAFAGQLAAAPAVAGDAIRPFRARISQPALDDLPGDGDALARSGNRARPVPGCTA